MSNNDRIQAIRTELETAIELAKCQKCGCLHDTLAHLATLLPMISANQAEALAQDINKWVKQLPSMEYACLGCVYCHPAIAQNELVTAFPSVAQLPATSCCDFQVSQVGWPPVVGEYFVVDETAPVAVSTLASVQLAENLALQKPQGLAIVGKTETENIGIDKVIKNIITNPNICYLVVAGEDSQGHQTGQTLLALSENGTDAQGCVIGSPGTRPILRNVSADEIDAFRNQVQVIDMMGCDSPDAIKTQIEALARQAVSGGCDASTESADVSISTVPTIEAVEAEEDITIDQAGYFVIVPLTDRAVINVEHYTYDNTLLHVIEGTNARALYTMIIANGWVTELSHAAYLGKELAKAELALKHGFKYVQGGA